ncbi:MAG: insulinase family protein [Alphaproteobacteria bacterium]|nr:insulinase family protein [Alphaproteobacteria bacterium]
MTSTTPIFHSLKSLSYVFIFIIAFGLFYNSPAYADKVFNAQSYTLENGMDIVVIPNHRAPVVTHMVWYRVGAADESQGLSGIAHFLEHLMFKGSPVIGGDDLKPGELSKIVSSLGGRDNAFTGQDYTAYYQSIATKHLETVMRMEAGRMENINPPPEHVLSERDVIREERRQRTDNDPHALFNEELATAIYPNHPYGVPVIGWADEMEVLSWDDTKAFYDMWYAPNNATLIISGDVTGNQVYELAQKIYGQIQKHELPPRNRTSHPPKTKKQFPIKYEHKSIRQPLVKKAYKVPSFHQNKYDALALQIIEEIIGNGSTSRLYKSLVIEQKIASESGLYYNCKRLDKTSLWVYASPLPDIELEVIENALDLELKKLIENGVTAEELSDAKSRMQNKAIYARDSLTAPAMIIGSSLAAGLNLNDIEYWPDDISKVTAAQIQNVAKRYLDPEKNTPVTGYLLPKKPENEKQPEQKVMEEPEQEVME